MKIDYCTFTAKESEMPVLISHLRSLRNFCPDMFNIKVSTPLDLDHILGADEVIKFPYYKQVSNNNGLCFDGYDAANRVDHIIKQCTSTWVVVAHCDLIYTSSLMDGLGGLLGENVGMIGQWTWGLTILNREIYNNCHMGFWPLYGVHLAPSDNLVGVEDREGCHTVGSPDVSQLLRIEMQGLGYHCELLNWQAASIYRHPVYTV